MAVEQSGDSTSIERSAMRKVTMRVVVFLAVCYFVAYIDRVNVGFAAIAMGPAIGLSAKMYGLGAGIFFIAYFLFGVPSNLILDKVGARRWIALLLISWGIVSMSMASVKGVTSFLVLRFMLGATEAGFYPGVLLLLSRWFPASERAKVIGMFSLAGPVSAGVGASISGPLLEMNGVMGLAGWQWLFLLEAAPAVILGITTFFFLPDDPRTAAWLTDDERRCLKTLLERDLAKPKPQEAEPRLMSVFAQPETWILGLVFAGATVSTYGMTLWLPLIIKSYGLTNIQTGLVSALPFLSAAVGMIVWGRHSDKHNERLWHTAATFMVTATALALTIVFRSLVPMVLLSIVAVTSANSLRGPFWALATEWVPAKTRGLSIGTINALGNLGGFVGPFMIGWIKDETGSFALTMLPLIGLSLVAITAVFSMNAIRERRGLLRAKAA